MKHLVRQAISPATFRRKAGLWATFAGMFGCVGALLICESRWRFGPRDPVTDLIWSAIALATLAQVISGMGRLLPAARWTQRRQLEDDLARATETERNSYVLPPHVVLECPDNSVFDEHEEAQKMAKRRRATAKSRLESHQQSGRSARIRWSWTLALCAFGVGLLASPWTVWLGSVSASPAVALAGAAQVAAAVTVASGLASFARSVDRWPDEPREAPNLPSLSPVYAVFLIPVGIMVSRSIGASGPAAFVAAAPGYAALIALIAARRVFESSACNRLEAAWKVIGGFHRQRQIERVTKGCVDAAARTLAVGAALLLSLGIAFAACDPQTGGMSITAAGYVALFAWWLGQIGALRIEHQGQMIPARVFTEIVESHPLGVSGVVLVLTAMAPALAWLSGLV